MAFFDRMTDESFRRSDGGEIAYVPQLIRGSARLLPTAHEEEVMRRAVRNVSRYRVLVVCPIFVLTQIYLHMDEPFGWRDGVVLVLLLAALLLPVEMRSYQLSKHFAPVEARTAEKWAADIGDGPTLGAAVALSAFTVWIGLAGLMVAYGFAANYFHL